MKTVFLFFVLALFFIASASSQVDSISTDTLIRLQTGIYANFEEFKNNDPSLKVEVVNSVYNMFLGYTDSTGTTRHLKKKEVWGYCINGAVFLGVRNYVTRIAKLGEIMHFIDEKKHASQFILDFKTGEVLKYNFENVSRLLYRDKELFDEFYAIGDRTQMDRQMFQYVIKYNERNPISFPIWE